METNNLEATNLQAEQMESAARSTDAVLVLASLANEARLEIFRQLVQAGPQGLAAGEIAGRLRMPASTCPPVARSFTRRSLRGCAV